MTSSKREALLEQGLLDEGDEGNKGGRDKKKKKAKKEKERL